MSKGGKYDNIPILPNGIPVDTPTGMDLRGEHVPKSINWCATCGKRYADFKPGVHCPQCKAALDKQIKDNADTPNGNLPPGLVRVTKRTKPVTATKARPKVFGERIFR